MSPRANKVIYQRPYKLYVLFTNGEEKLFDLRPYLSYPVYEKLVDEDYGAKVKVQHGIIIWDEETDLDPDRLYLESIALPVAQP